MGLTGLLMGNERFKILVADDDEDLRELLPEAIRSWGYEVTVARDGMEAISVLRAERHDLLLADLMMPFMDGISLIGKIREFDSDILVIIITGNASMEHAVKAIEAGAHDFIAKPFRLDELMVIIKNARERSALNSEIKTLKEELRAARDEIAALKGELARVKAKT